MLIGLGAARPAPPPEPFVDVATALERARTALGQRPAITVHHGAAVGEPRHEQGFVSLAGWVAKGAHLVRDELGLGPGDALGLAGPACWPVATVALAAWWVGVTLVPAERARIAVVHTASGGPTADGATLLWLGDAIDGTGDLDPHRPWGEWWTEAVIPFPDRAPVPARDGDLVAVRTDARTSTQRELLASLSPSAGALGLVRRPTDTSSLDIEVLSLLALRPLVTGSPTVVLVDTDGTLDDEDSPSGRIAATERIVSWYPPRD
jgi:hypothetical protein